MQYSKLFQKPSNDESITWWARFNDPVLDKLVQTAFAQNLSLRSAALRIMEARAQLGLVKGELFPQVQEASGDLSTIGTTGPSENRSYKGVSVGFDAAWKNVSDLPIKTSKFSKRVCSWSSTSLKPAL